MNNLTSLALVLALSQLFSQRTTENEDVGVGTGGGAGQGRSKGQGSNMAGMMGMGLLGTGLMAGMRGSSSLLPNLLGGLTGGRGGRSSMMGRLGGMAGGMRGRSGRMEQGFDMDMPSMQESRQGQKVWKPAEPFHLVLALPGRRRYRAQMSGELAKLLQDKLPRLAFLKSCQIHPETGSLLFTYEPTEEKEAAMDRLAEFLEKQIFCIS